MTPSAYCSRPTGVPRTDNAARFCKHSGTYDMQNLCRPSESGTSASDFTILAPRSGRNGYFVLSSKFMIMTRFRIAGLLPKFLIALFRPLDGAAQTPPALFDRIRGCCSRGGERWIGSQNRFDDFLRSIHEAILHQSGKYLKVPLPRTHVVVRACSPVKRYRASI